MAFSQPTTLTWAQAKARVAQVAGSQNDADQLLQAGYALEEAIRYWENSKDWKYSIIESAASLDASETEIPLPSDCKKIYNLRVTNDGYERVLHYMDKRKFDIEIPKTSNYPFGTVPTHYYLGTRAGVATAVVLPTNSVALNVAIFYFRKSTIPAGITDGTTADDATVVDFPEKFDYALLSLARMFYLMYKGGEEKRLELISAIAQENLKKCRGEDEWTTDQVSGFQPPPNRTATDWASELPWGDW